MDRVCLVSDCKPYGCPVIALGATHLPISAPAMVDRGQASLSRAARSVQYDRDLCSLHRDYAHDRQRPDEKCAVPIRSPLINSTHWQPKQYIAYRSRLFHEPYCDRTVSRGHQARGTTQVTRSINQRLTHAGPRQRAGPGAYLAPDDLVDRHLIVFERRGPVAQVLAPRLILAVVHELA